MHWVKYIRESVVAVLFKTILELLNQLFEWHFVKSCDKRAYQVWFSDILYLSQTDSSFLLQFSQFVKCSLFCI